MTARRWSDLTDHQQTALLAGVSVQFALVATARSDLATRPAELVNGRKSVWAVLIAVSFLGPIMYFLRGRRAR